MMMISVLMLMKTFILVNSLFLSCSYAETRLLGFHQLVDHIYLDFYGFWDYGLGGFPPLQTDSVKLF